MESGSSSSSSVRGASDFTLKVGIGASACSRNSRMVGVMMVSSWILCKVIQAVRVAFLLLLLEAATSLLEASGLKMLSSVLEM